MKRGKGPPTKLDEIVADAARQEAEGSELSPEEWERIIAEARRYEEPLEEMSPELWRMVEQMLYPDRRCAATTMPRNAPKTAQTKAGSVEPCPNYEAHFVIAVFRAKRAESAA